MGHEENGGGSAGARQMTQHERKFYKQKMKAIRDALRRGNKAAANRHANDLKAFFGVE